VCTTLLLLSPSCVLACPDLHHQRSDHLVSFTLRLFCEELIMVPIIVELADAPVLATGSLRFLILALISAF